MKIQSKIFTCFLSMTFLSAGFIFKQPEQVFADDQISALTNQQNELDKQNEALNARLSSLKNDIRSQKAYKASVNEKINVLKKQINIEEQKLNILNQEISEKQAQAEAIQREIDESTDDLCAILRAIYKNGEAPELVVLFESDDMYNFVEIANWIKLLSSRNAELIDDLQENSAKLEEDKEIIEKNKQDAEESTRALEIKREELRKLQKDCEKLLTSLQREEKNLQSKINANRAKRNQALNTTQPHKTGRYMHPLRGAGRVSSEFGPRGRHFHNGIDFAAPMGTPIVAVADGIVTVATRGSGWGIHVKINHGDGCETISAHMSRLNVVPGQYVKAGNVIGYVGNTGWSSGNHLHFGTAKNGRWYNPRTEL